MELLLRIIDKRPEDKHAKRGDVIAAQADGSFWVNANAPPIIGESFAWARSVARLR